MPSQTGENEMTKHTAAGYMIQDIQGSAIYGVGETVDEAWAQVVDGVGTFHNAHGDEISPDEAYETQFKAYGATAELIAHVNDYGGEITWDVTEGVAHLPESDE